MNIRRHLSLMLALLPGLMPMQPLMVYVGDSFAMTAGAEEMTMSYHGAMPVASQMVDV